MSHWPELGHMPSLNQSLAKIKGILLHQTGAPSGLREAFQTQAAQGGRVDEMLKSQPQKKKKKVNHNNLCSLRSPQGNVWMGQRVHETLSQQGASSQSSKTCYIKMNTDLGVTRMQNVPAALN